MEVVQVVEVDGPENYKGIRLLGQGNIGRVFLAQHVHSGRLFAVKVLLKRDVKTRKKEKNLQTEEAVLRKANHPLITSLYSSFETPLYHYFVLEYCPKSLVTLLKTQQGSCFPERAARFYAAEVLLALEYLHLLGFIYRDLKPENILIRESGHIALTDFDLSEGGLRRREPRIFDNGYMDTEPGVTSYLESGTPEYLAPEVIHGSGHTSSVDWWALGVLMYEMLYGKTPFVGPSNKAIVATISKFSSLKFPAQAAYPVSDISKELIQRLVFRNPQERLGSQSGSSEIKGHEFFKGVLWNLVLNCNPPFRPFIDAKTLRVDLKGDHDPFVCK